MSRGAPIPWIPKSPPGWPIQRAKTVLYRAKVLNRNRDEQQVLSLTLRGVVDNDPENPEGLVPEDYATYQIFEADDLVFKLIDLENVRTSRVGQVPKRGIMSSAYLRLRPRPGVSVRYLYWSFFDLYNRQIFNHLGSGVRSTLGADDVLNLPLLVPDLDTQQAIADYLDTETTRIDDLITKKQRMLELLRERQKLNTEEEIAFLRMRSDVVALKHLVRESDARRGSDVDRQLLSVSIHHGVVPRTDATDKESRADDFSNYKICEPGDVVLNRMRAFQGAVGVASSAGIVSPDYTVMRLEPRLDSGYSHFLMRSHWFIGEMASRIRGIGAVDQGQVRTPRVNFADLRTIEIPVPPIKEQLALVTSWRESENRIRSIVDRLEIQIDLLGEHRQALIAAAVTGEFEVSGVAA